MLRIDGLDQDNARQIAAPRAPGRLRQKLKRALGGAEIRQTQSDVGRHDAHQRDIRNVVALGDHLRAHQDVEIAFAKTVQDALEMPLAAHRVAIHARDPRLGKIAMQLFFDFLRAGPDEVQILAPALRTHRWNLLRIVAVVAQHAAIAPVIG